MKGSHYQDLPTHRVLFLSYHVFMNIFPLTLFIYLLNITNYFFILKVQIIMIPLEQSTDISWDSNTKINENLIHTSGALLVVRILCIPLGRGVYRGWISLSSTR